MAIDLRSVLFHLVQGFVLLGEISKLYELVFPRRVDDIDTFLVKHHGSPLVLACLGSVARLEVGFRFLVRVGSRFPRLARSLVFLDAIIVTRFRTILERVIRSRLFTIIALVPFTVVEGEGRESRWVGDSCILAIRTRFRNYPCGGSSRHGTISVEGKRKNFFDRWILR